MGDVLKRLILEQNNIVSGFRGLKKKLVHLS